MKRILVIAALVLVSTLVACSNEPEIIVVTVEVPIEVTRIVSEVAEVEVTRVVEKTVEVEVTREVMVTSIVELIVTATHTPTPDITPTPTQTATPQEVTAPQPPSTPSLLQTMRSIRRDMESYGGLIDAALRGDPVPCATIVEIYDRIARAPTMTVGSNQQNAYNSYRASLEMFLTGTRDMTQNCRDFLARGDGAGTIPFQQWGLARQKVNDALDILIPVIVSLE
jgi:hypothetical protein